MKRILLVDDQPLVLEVLKLSFEYSGYAVDCATNGREAIKMFRAAPADIVVTDILMPEQDGLETIRDLRAASKAVKIIAISGGRKIGGGDFLDAARRVGADLAFTKPVRNSQLIAAVRELLEKDET